MIAIYAEARQEDRSAIWLLTWASAIFFGITALYYVWTIAWIEPIPRDATTLVVGRDFLNFWMYGRAAWLPDPSRFYNVHLYQDMLATFLGSLYPGQNWSYPPSIMFLAAPFGRLPYLAALACWTAVGLAFFVWTVSRYVGERRLLAPILLSPAVVFCLISGQNSLATTAILLIIMTYLDRRPLLAGLLIGILTLKPQLGLLFPVMLAASGRWRAFSVAAVTALVIAAATAAVFGPQAWIDFIREGLPAQNAVLADPERIATPYYPTIFMNLRGTGTSYPLAMAVQACFAALAVGAVFFAYRARKDADPRMLAALFFACSICAVPYLLSYDLVPMTCVAISLLAAGKLDERGQIIAKLVYWLPLIQMTLGQFHLPGAALIPPAFALYAFMSLTGRNPAATGPRDGGFVNRCDTPERAKRAT